MSDQTTLPPTECPSCGATADGQITHCEWCGAEYPIPDAASNPDEPADER